MKERIILYGCGEEAKRFYLQNYNKYEIVFAIDKNAETLRLFYRVPVFVLDEVRSKIRDTKIMIAMNSSNYQAVKKNLLELGLKENEDFVWWKEKLKAIIYGNCHMNVIKEILLSSSEFKRRYTLNMHSVNSLDEKVLENDLAYADLVISQDIKDDNKLKVPGVNDIKKRTMGVVLTIPNLYGMNFFYPQLCGKINIDLSFYNSVHVNMNGRGDSFVEDSYENGCDILTVINQIKSGNVYDSVHVKKLFKNTMGKLKERELYCDISISDFIEEKYQIRQLFYEPQHPTNLVLFEKANRILQKLDMCRINWDKSRVSPMNGMDGKEIFIYGCVKKELGLKFEQDQIRNNYSQTLTGAPYCIEEWVEDYYKMLDVQRGE